MVIATALLWTFGDPYFSFQKTDFIYNNYIIYTLSKNEQKINVGS